MPMPSRIQRLEEALAMVCLLASTLVVFAGGVARFLGHPLDWSIDLATFFFAWAVFLGADLALKEGRHVAVDTFLAFLPPKVRWGVRLLTWSLVALFLLLLAYYGFQMAYLTRFRSFQGIPGFSYTWVTLSVALGSLLMLLTALGKLRELLRRGPWS
ncbi:TRAP transporter small permease [Thermus oshimai]|uniref:TRAP-type C4-dicarboxylate transport system, small permease component n=1 Tax=Thermus oshimai JL-2 TaxID=751945 RepID=K7RLX9_THEOS|nr:TRAP transporter small permease [Thermus oshimai]AFV77387.1 TRAP-type C4-dicarboxylate transport system, small permease component [Thermus oshimai JL-2]